MLYPYILKASSAAPMHCGSIAMEPQKEIELSANLSKNATKWPKNDPKLAQNDPKWPKNDQHFFRNFF